MKNGTGSLAIQNGFLVDGTGAAAIPNGMVLIHDGNVLKDITLLQDRSKILAVLQRGIAKAGSLPRQ